MRVIDHAPSWWYLLEDGTSVLLDVNCNHSFVGYCFTIKLNGEELAAYARAGASFINQLANHIQDSAPILEASTSPFKGRDVSKVVSAELASAVARWRAESVPPEP